MSHSFNKIWIHAIWATKERKHLIQPDIETLLHNFITKQFADMGCSVKIINGTADHIHCLFLLNKEKSVADVMKQVKGGSSHFINQNNFIKDKFAWKTGYAAFSISESVLPKLCEYIKNQKQHHIKKTFEQEYNEFLKIYGLNEMSLINS